MTEAEFKALIADLTKRILGSISWTQDKKGTGFEFRVKVISESGEQLSIKGSHNRKLGKTSYTLYLLPIEFLAWTMTEVTAMPVIFIFIVGIVTSKNAWLQKRMQMLRSVKILLAYGLGSASEQASNMKGL